jgi:proteasome assembly chaperone (PAC2) family protein
MPHVILDNKPSLRRPILIVAFGGMNDAGHAATLALQHLVSSMGATKFAEIDPEDFYDFSVNRPWVRLGPDGERQITWPVNTFWARESPVGGLDAILFLGTEPSLHWRTYIRDIISVVQELDVSLVVTLGANHAQISHRNNVPIAGWAWPTELKEKLNVLGVHQVAYEGPTGVLTALGCALADAKIPVASLWAALPAFVGATPNPTGALALLKRLDDAADLGLDLRDLVEASADFDRNVDKAILRARAMPGVSVFQASDKDEAAKTPETAGFDGSAVSTAELPPADEVIQDAEDFLRGLRGK